MTQNENSELALGERKGLPADLYYLLERYSRDQWQGHENLGGMARFWLQRHDIFRELGGMLDTSVGDYLEQKLEAQPFASFFVPRLQFFLQQLHGHHQIEDMHYFPVFERAETGLKRGFALLDNDHHVIHNALERNAHGANYFLGKLGEGATPPVLPLTPMPTTPRSSYKCCSVTLRTRKT
jgi:Hemerythrin HHE cation binding domain